MLNTLAGYTEAVSGFGKNSTASAAEEDSPGVSMVMYSVMVMVLAVALGLGAGFGATATLGAGEQIDWTQRSAASADLGMLAICEELGQLTG